MNLQPALLGRGFEERLRDGFVLWSGKGEVEGSDDAGGEGEEGGEGVGWEEVREGEGGVSDEGGGWGGEEESESGGGVDAAV